MKLSFQEKVKDDCPHRALSISRYNYSFSLLKTKACCLKSLSRECQIQAKKRLQRSYLGGMETPSFNTKFVR